MKRAALSILAVLIIPLLITACDSAGTGDGGGGNGGGGGGGHGVIQLIDAFPGLTFESPVDLENAGDGSGRLFVVEQRGVIMAVTPSDEGVNSSSGTAVQKQAEAAVFLDISNRVLFDGGERGLLGVAFHPDFADNGFFYVDYNADNPNRTVISRFKVMDGNPSIADPNSEVILLEFNQPSANHKGGQLAFGPDDGFLYIAVGDGGTGGDTAQDRTDLLGSILRIDVDNTNGDMNYAIPPGNPFAGNDSGFREEIFAYGFRNPWRFSFDGANGRLFVGDVGENTREEIDLVESGKNYGWNTMEGSLCFNPPVGCDTAGLELPIYEYGRDIGGTIIVGPVYRGVIPELSGKLIYGDFLSGTIRALLYDGSGVTENSEFAEVDPFTLSSFGHDEEGEVYACSLDGSIYKIVEQ
ncbi:MAG TPA: PQQ-dependent sugar dehydrogenase [Thermodesulfobacteriota bacterium]|nr:PQQ-dependent sugar dehydrogenase [Thermodesulfobacteriota bacterium]